MVKILIIDDDPVISQMISSELTKNGYVLSRATTGKGGIDAVKSEHPDCIILDQILPDMLGIEILQTIRAEDASKHTPVIFYTSINDEEMKKQAMQLGVSRFLMKFSTDVSTLATVVNGVL